MSVFKLHLVNLADESDLWNAAFRRQVANELGGLFRRVVRSPLARPVRRSEVRWATGAGAVRPGDLVVYFSTSRESGIARHVTSESLRHSETGQTLHNDSRGKISEIYIAGHEATRNFDSLSTAQKAALVAKGAFHECMHNKLYPRDIHTVGGGGLALTPLLPDYGLTGDNIRYMAPALQLDVPQNTGYM